MAKKEEPKTEIAASTVQEDSDEAEIIDDDEPNLALIEQTKARFELKKLKEEKKKQSASTTSKIKPQSVIDLNPEGFDAESQPPSVPQSKIKDFNSFDCDQLKAQIFCISCEEKPKCMMIATCKHIPFCSDCDKNWSLKAADNH